MIELSNKRVEQILHEETVKTEELPTILRGIYTRYMRLYENYFADIDALNDEKIAELREYHEETRSLVKYYYMDIPLDICTELNEFDKECCTELLGSDWHDYLYDSYRDFLDDCLSEYESEECFKAEFAEEKLAAFYDAMDSILRDGFSSGSQTGEKVASGITDMLVGKKE